MEAAIREELKSAKKSMKDVSNSLDLIEKYLVMKAEIPLTKAPKTAKSISSLQQLLKHNRISPRTIKAGNLPDCFKNFSLYAIILEVEQKRDEANRKPEKIALKDFTTDEVFKMNNWCTESIHLLKNRVGQKIVFHNLRISPTHQDFIKQDGPFILNFNSGNFQQIIFGDDEHDY